MIGSGFSVLTADPARALPAASPPPHKHQTINRQCPVETYKGHHVALRKTNEKNGHRNQLKGFSDINNN